MKSLLSFLFIAAVTITTGLGQVKDAAKNVQDQANKMGASFMNEDFKVFATFMNPKILSMMGGEDKLTMGMKKVIDDMRSRNMTFKSITFGSASPMFKVGNQLQCTIPQHTEINTSPGRAVSTSTLVAISTDNGKTWKFIDTSNKDKAVLKQILPDLSNSIVIPPAQPPVHYNN